jgi:hypothetical protein
MVLFSLKIFNESQNNTKSNSTHLAGVHQDESLVVTKMTNW